MRQRTLTQLVRELRQAEAAAIATHGPAFWMGRSTELDTCRALSEEIEAMLAPVFNPALEAHMQGFTTRLELYQTLARHVQHLSEEPSA